MKIIKNNRKIKKRKKNCGQSECWENIKCIEKKNKIK